MVEKLTFYHPFVVFYILYFCTDHHVILFYGKLASQFKACVPETFPEYRERDFTSFVWAHEPINLGLTFHLRSCYREVQKRGI